MEGTDKITRILSLFYNLLTNQTVSKDTFCMEHKINERSFDRDIENIRIYLSEMRPYCELKYDRVKNTYYLTHTFENPLKGELTLFIANLLLSIKNISEDEMYKMLNILYNSTAFQERHILERYIKERIAFRRKIKRRPVLKVSWEIEKVIQNKNIIEIEYAIDENLTEKQKIKPMQTIATRDAVYLLAYQTDKNYNCPELFRLDRIKSFKIIEDNLNEQDQIELERRLKTHVFYNADELDNLTVVIKVDCDLKMAVSDYFEQCKFIKAEGKYDFFKINTSKQVFIQWLISQEAYVKVIEPKWLQNDIRNHLNIKLNKCE